MLFLHHVFLSEQIKMIWVCTPGASFELKFRGGRAERPKASRPCQRRGAGGVWGRGVPLPSGDGVWGGGITIYEVSVWK